jgi:hypothetical protein
MWVRAALVFALLACAPGAASAADETDQRSWKLTATALGYLVPDHDDFVMVLVPVDVRRLHVEGRYNYEALRSASAFVGLNAGWGERLALHVTPMIGAVGGDLDGWVPALRWTLAWWKLDVYSESEVVFDFADAADSFFYTWSELGISPVGWLRGGIAIQRSRVFQTSLALQRGLFAGVTFHPVTVAIYEFNALWTAPTWVVSVGISL